jgi:hypothetical protein
MGIFLESKFPGSVIPILSEPIHILLNVFVAPQSFSLSVEFLSIDLHEESPGKFVVFKRFVGKY